jgi:phosphatidylinositol-3-phosphatase
MVAIRRRRLAPSALLVTAVALTACGSGGRTSAGPSPGSSAAGTVTASVSAPPASAQPAPSTAPPTASPAVTGLEGVPRFAHIIVVVEENKSYGELVGPAAPPFLTALARSGAVLTQSYAITHPSQPNYLALFSGSTYGLTSDSCPHQFTGPNLGAALLAAGDTFAGYAESLPAVGYRGCRAGEYARKHAPWTDFTLPNTVNRPMTAFPADFRQLPSLAIVIPNLQDDMHDGSIAKGDDWLAAHLSAYRNWATSHNSLLVITTDEDDSNHANHITTILAGAHIAPGHYSRRTSHYGLLRTLLDSFRLAPFGHAATTTPITGVWAR